METYKVVIIEDPGINGDMFYDISMYDGERRVNEILFSREELRQLYNLLLVEFACDIK